MNAADVLVVGFHSTFHRLTWVPDKPLSFGSSFRLLGEVNTSSNSRSVSVIPPETLS